VDRQRGKYYVFAKGAPEQILKCCDQRLHGGRLAILTKAIREELLEQNEKFNQQALRTMGLAYREMSTHEVGNLLAMDEFSEKQTFVEKKLTFIGLAGLSDPPREEVAEAVKLTKIAGIKSYIVTGDHGFTTAAIAKKIGLISEKTPYEIITGEQLEKLDDQTLLEKFRQRELDIIFSRTKPEHKLRLVSLLKANNEIVAVTGDGVNDAPALKRADIGVAMGISGSDVSKEAANMVLMDDSFSTIVTAIREGRTIYANLKKFIFYIFSCNIGELFTIFVSLLIGLVSPLTAVLILTVNLATDLLPALALGLEPAEKDIMEKPPRHPEEKIMNSSFIFRVLTTGSLMGIILLSQFIYKLYSNGWQWGTPIAEEMLRQASSMVFIGMVMIQVANAFNSKSEEKSIFKTNPLNNHKLIWANLSSVLMAVAIVEIPILQQFFRTSSLHWEDWLLIISGCLAIVVFMELLKFASRKKIQSSPSL
jgi:Ca2+-transporting ATPase